MNYINTILTLVILILLINHLVDGNINNYIQKILSICKTKFDKIFNPTNTIPLSKPIDIYQPHSPKTNKETIDKKVINKKIIKTKPEELIIELPDIQEVINENEIESTFNDYFSKPDEYNDLFIKNKSEHNNDIDSLIPSVEFSNYEASSDTITSSNK